MAATLLRSIQQIPWAMSKRGCAPANLCRPGRKRRTAELTDVIADTAFAPTARRRKTISSREVCRRKDPGHRQHRDRRLVRSVRRSARNADQRWPGRRNASLPPSHDRRRSILVTGHRRESFGDGFERHLHGARASWPARDRTSTIVFPVHLQSECARACASAARRSSRTCI